jgi:hypothetical protein
MGSADLDVVDPEALVEPFPDLVDVEIRATTDSARRAPQMRKHAEAAMKSLGRGLQGAQILLLAFMFSCDDAGTSPGTMGGTSDAAMQACADWFDCADGVQRVLAQYQCDGMPDCDDGWDEVGCP